MKKIFSLLLLCFSFATQGQNYWDMPQLGEDSDKIRAKNNKIKRVTIKFADYDSPVASPSLEIEFDSSGNRLKETSYRFGTHETWYYQYELKGSELAKRMVIMKSKGKRKKNHIDSTIQVQLNDTIQESKFYISGKLTFYKKIISNKQQQKLTELDIAYNSSLMISYFEDRGSDSIIQTKFLYPTKYKIQVTSFFNNDKKEYSNAIVHLDSLKRISKEEIISFHSKSNTFLEYLVIYIYDDKGLLKRKYSITQEEYTKLQKDPNAKITLLGYEDYEYNEKGLLIKNTTFYKENFYAKPIKKVETHTYEYW